MTTYIYELFATSTETGLKRFATNDENALGPALDDFMSDESVVCIKLRDRNVGMDCINIWSR